MCEHAKNRTFLKTQQIWMVTPAKINIEPEHDGFGRRVSFSRGARILRFQPVIFPDVIYFGGSYSLLAPVNLSGKSTPWIIRHKVRDACAASYHDVYVAFWCAPMGRWADLLTVCWLLSAMASKKRHHNFQKQLWFILICYVLTISRWNWHFFAPKAVFGNLQPDDIWCLLPTLGWCTIPETNSKGTWK